MLRLVSTPWKIVTKYGAPQRLSYNCDVNEIIHFWNGHESDNPLLILNFVKMLIFWELFSFFIFYYRLKEINFEIEIL